MLDVFTLSLCQTDGSLDMRRQDSLLMALVSIQSWAAITKDYSEV